MEQDRGLVINHRWPVHNNGRLVINYWTAMDYKGGSMYHDIGSVIDLGGWVIDNRWALHHDSIFTFGIHMFRLLSPVV
jgi:hypothetical protein